MSSSSSSSSPTTTSCTPATDAEANGSSNAFRSDPIIVLDLETTGLDHRCERIIEIGAVRLEGGQIVEEFSTLVKPDVPIRHSSFKVHGISDEMVADAPSIEDVLPKFLEFMGDLPFVAHNAIFDYSFLNEASKRLYDERLKNHRVDTFEMYRVTFPEEQSHGLTSLLDRFGFEQPIKHRALEDAANLGRVFPLLREHYEQKLSWQLSQLKNISYLVERYQRLQRTMQLLQAEITDLRELFKLHFTEGGKPVTATNGEMLVTSYRRQYDYNEAELRKLLEDCGLQHKTFKVNIKAVDRLIDRGDIDTDIRRALIGTRTRMSENRVISFIKPVDYEPAAEEDSNNSGSEEENA
ncbi:MAG: 3'-5' exonuclease [Cyanobacteria bacterium HKST-UBA04]|nr:3'-5' exonuclease [Cyanobacteria bacterium HKST-UBA04]